MTWQTPKAFLNNLCVNVAADSRSKCKYSTKKIQAGDLCVLFKVGGYKGESPTTQPCSLMAAAGFINTVAVGAGVSLKASGINGFSALSSEGKKTVEALLKTKGPAVVMKRPCASTATSSAAKRRKA